MLLEKENFEKIYSLFKSVKLRILKKEFSSIEDCIKFCDRKNSNSYNNKELSNYSFQKFLQNKENFKFENNYSHKFLIETLLIYLYKFKKLPRILDVGGVFGENKLYLDHLLNNKEIIYDVVKVPNKVSLTKNLNHSIFYDNIDQALKNKYDLLFTSSTLQYYEKTYEIIIKILKSEINYIGFTRGNYHPDKELYMAQPSYIYQNGPGEGFVNIKTKNSKIIYYHNTAISYLKFRRLVLENKYKIIRETNGLEGNFGQDTFNKNILLEKQY